MIGMGTGRGTSPQMALMTPTPPIRIPKEVIMREGDFPLVDAPENEPLHGES